jgi:ribosome-associated protein
MAAPSPAARAAQQRLAQLAASSLLENKAQDVVLLDLAPVTDMTDFFVIASGTSDTHVRSTAEHVIEAMRKAGHRVHHVEGLTQGRWVLLDFVDVVVHVFHPALRSFYQLERLWSDATAVPVAAQGTA